VDDGARSERAARARAAVATLQERGVVAVALTFVDNSGISRVKTVPLDRLPEAAAWGVGMSPVFDFFLVDDAIAPEGGPVGDLRLVPDLERLTVLAAQPGWAWAPVDRFTQDGEPHPACQRTFARRMAAQARLRDLDLLMGIEIEWAVGDEDAQRRFVPACTGPAYGAARLAELTGYVAALHRALAEEGLAVLQIHPEYAAGQFEVSLAPSDPVGAADTEVLARETVRAVTLAHGMRPAFGPAVVPGAVGNGGHLHLSLAREGRNLLSTGTGRYGMTETGESFLAGVLDALPALVAIGAPSPASYLRLVASHWAGAFRCWGWENREAALRLVTGSAGGREREANAEVKCFDLAANPYLLVGAVIAAGLGGVDAASRLPEEVSADPASLDAARLGALGVERLPTSLGAAIDLLSGCPVLRQAMGDDLFTAFLAVRRAENARFADTGIEDLVSRTRWRY
jgi:glutamine synthetase